MTSDDVGHFVGEDECDFVRASLAEIYDGACYEDESSWQCECVWLAALYGLEAECSVSVCDAWC